MIYIGDNKYLTIHSLYFVEVVVLTSDHERATPVDSKAFTALEGQRKPGMFSLGFHHCFPRCAAPAMFGHPLTMGRTKDMGWGTEVWWTAGQKSNPMVMPIHELRVGEGIHLTQGRSYLPILICIEKFTSHLEWYQSAYIFGCKSTNLFYL